MKSTRKMLMSMIALCMLLAVFLGKEVKASSVGTITSITQTRSESSFVTISWSYFGASSNIKYEIDYSMSPNGGFTTYKKDITGSSMTISGLQAGTTYFVRIRPYSGTTYGDYSSVIAVATNPSSKPGNLKHTNSTLTSISLSWDTVAGATGYRILYNPCSSSEEVKTIDTASTSITLSGLSKDTEYSVKVYPFRQAGAYYAYSNSNTYCSSLSNIPVLPTKATGFAVSSYGYFGLTIFETDSRASADGFEIQIYDGSKKIITYADSGSSGSDIRISSDKLKKYKFYKAKVRGYISTASGKKYGDWSSWIYISRSPSANLKKSSSNTLSMSWKKVSGATNYTVYISTKANSGYKKVVTTKSRSCKIKKYGKQKLKKNKVYYVYVIANKKVGKKTWRSTDKYFYSIKL